jgi:Family of unknown function (DUF5977)
MFCIKKISLTLILITGFIGKLFAFNSIKYVEPFYWMLPHSAIYGYADNVLVADIENAILDEVAFSSFEDNTYGNWTFNNAGIQYINGNKSITGTKYYSLTAGNITKNFLNVLSKNMIVSYWSRSGVQTVNNSTTAQSGRSVLINGVTWTYYQHTLSSPVSITISGTGIIDELRLYPEDAYMTTYTYQPFAGITTFCDAVNNINYNEYDSYNRLIVIRDQDYKVIKKYCYNTASQSENCSGQLFLSVIKSGVYQRNNCESGLLGSSVTYSVPAGTYTSSVDQSSADLLAQNDVNDNGQSYANINGSCLYLSAAKSGSFIRNNCGTNFTGGTVTYTVAAGAYTSDINQSDADQKAQNDVNTNGQNYANTNGACLSNCSFIAVFGFSMLTSSISSNGSMVSFYIVFRPNSTGTNWGSDNQIAILTNCRPSAIRTFIMTENGRTWKVSVYPTGQFYIRLVSGSAPTSFNPISLTGGSYSL